MPSQHQKRDIGPRKPCAFLYLLACFLPRLYFSIVNGLRIDNRAIKDIKAPALVLCNHQSNLDFLIAAAAAFPLRVNVMVTTYFFHNKKLRWLLNIMGAIPKKQFTPDSTAIKSVMKVIARGGSVGIFPEGQVCYTGANCDVDDSIAKLIKKLGVTVVNLKIRGNHLTAPKWAKGKASYRGRVECTAEVLFTPEQLQAMSVSDIAAQTCQAIAYDEYAWQQQRMVPYKPLHRKTDGLEVVLHRCPRCNTDFVMCSDDNVLYCEKCNYRVRLNAYGLFEAVDGCEPVYNNPAEWYQAQTTILQSTLTRNALFPFQSPCTMFKTVEGKHGYTRCGEGIITLNEQGLVFDGEKDGAPFHMETLYERQTHVPHSAVYCAIDVHGDGENYAYAPKEKRHMLFMVEAYAIARRHAVQKKD